MYETPETECRDLLKPNGCQQTLRFGRRHKSWEVHWIQYILWKYGNSDAAIHFVTAFYLFILIASVRIKGYNKTRPSSNSHTKYLISPYSAGLWSISLDCFLFYKAGCGIIHQNILLFPGFAPCVMCLRTIALNTSDSAAAARP